MNTPYFEKADVVIITALEEERDAVLSKLPQRVRMPLSLEDNRTCFGAQLPVNFAGGSTGTYNVVVLCLTDMSTTPAATATSDVIRRWEPTLVLLVGIAGGVKKNDAALGDVLIATQIVDYTQQKLTNTKRQFRFKSPPVSEQLNGFSLNLMPSEWQPLITVPRPIEGQLKRLRGPVASGPTVVQQALLLKELLASYPKLIGLEMEAAGVAAAAAESVPKREFFMVRSVSDLCDSRKGSQEVKKWRSYVCDVAASYAIGLLKQGPIPSRTPLQRRRLSRNLPPLQSSESPESDDESEREQFSSLGSKLDGQSAIEAHRNYHWACDYIEERLSAPSDDDRDLMRLYLQNLIPHTPHLVWTPETWLIASWGDGITEKSFDRFFVAKRTVYPCLTSQALAYIQRGASREKQTLPLEDAVARHSKLVLLGDPGAGKTTSLRQLALEVLEKIFRKTAVTEDESGSPQEVTIDAPKFLVVPILVELKRFKGEAELEILMARSINDVLKPHGESLGADDAESVRRLKTWLLCPDAHFLLLFDGLNEVERTHHVAARAALQSVLSYPHPTVVSCREHDYDDSLRGLAAAHCLEALPDEAIDAFLSWFLEGKNDDSSFEAGHNLFRELKSDERLLSLARNPLLLRLIGEVAWGSPTADLPANRASLFERFITIMPQRRRQEGLDLGVDNYKVRAALRQLGFIMHERDTLKVDLEEVHRWLPEADESFDVALRQAQEWRFLESDGGRGIGIEFIHPLFIEFFAADALAERLRRGASLDEVVGAHAHDPRWRETMFLLGGLTDKPADLIFWLAEQARRTSSARTALLANLLFYWLALEGVLEDSQADGSAFNSGVASPAKADQHKLVTVGDEVLGAMLSVLSNPDNHEVLSTRVIDEDETWEQQREDIDSLEEEVASNEDAAPQVMAMFKSGNELLRSSATRMLTRLQHPAVEMLLEMLENPHTDVEMREQTIEVLAAIGDWRVTLKNTVHAPKPGSPRPKTPSGTSVGVQTGTMRVGTAEELRQQEIEKERQLLADLESHDQPPGLWSRRINLLRQALHHPTPKIRKAAVQALGQTHTYIFHRSDHPVDAVLEAATDSDEQVRMSALHALGQWMWDSENCEWWDDVKVMGTITQALNDSAVAVRYSALGALQQVPGEKAAQQLIALLEHAEAEMRLRAIFALKERRELSAIPALERLLSDNTKVELDYFLSILDTHTISDEALDAVNSIRRYHDEG